MIVISDIKKLGGFFSDIDLVFADFIVKQSSSPSSGEVFLAAALTSKAVREGHSCCDLEYYSGRCLKPESDSLTDDVVSITCPSLDEWLSILRSEPFMRIVSSAPGIRRTALVLDENNHLFLYRYYYYERELAGAVGRLKSIRLPECGFLPGTLGNISPYFRKSAANAEADYQQAAVWMALHSGFAVISGGPGTGKTTVVATLIAFELMRNRDIVIALSAPTGKAQARLKESLVAESQSLSCPDDIKSNIAGLKCATLHSLLGAINDSSKFRHNTSNPLQADLVVVDEASMVPLSLMAKLTAALKPGARLILLGDKDQLASVEAGAVLADICECGSSNHFDKTLVDSFRVQTGWSLDAVSDTLPLSGHITELVRNHRFRDDSGIGKISSKIRKLNSGAVNAEDVCADIIKMDDSEFRTVRPPRYSEIEARLSEIVMRKEITIERRKWSFSDIPELTRQGTREALETAFGIMSEFKILCGIRKGFFGCENINRIMRRILGMDDMIYVPGLPVMILRNDRMRNLYNGDTGIVWDLKDASGRVSRRVMFPNPDGGGLGGNDRFVPFLPSELPEHEDVFAMTIHKSQGSGFQKVLMLLPDRDCEVLTRELVYTGITRARESVELWADEDILRNSLARKTLRQSSLAFKIKQNISVEHVD